MRQELAYRIVVANACLGALDPNGNVSSLKSKLEKQAPKYDLTASAPVREILEEAS